MAASMGALRLIVDLMQDREFGIRYKASLAVEALALNNAENQKQFLSKHLNVQKPLNELMEVSRISMRIDRSNKRWNKSSFNRFLLLINLEKNWFSENVLCRSNCKFTWTFSRHELLPVIVWECFCLSLSLSLLLLQCMQKQNSFEHSFSETNNSRHSCALLNRRNELDLADRCVRLR